jgi:hypothetical protein
MTHNASKDSQNGIRYARQIMKHYAVSCTSTAAPTRSSCIRARSSDSWHRPVVLGDARPEDPDHHNGEECEKSLKETTVDLAAGACTDVDADNVLEDLSDSKEDDCAEEVDCGLLALILGLDLKNVRIGLRSPSTRRTRNDSRQKKMNRKTRGTNW